MFNYKYFFTLAFIPTIFSRPICRDDFNHEFNRDALNFIDWRHKYGVVYDSPEEHRWRFDIWRDNAKLVREHNSMDKGFHLELNYFSDQLWPLNCNSMRNERIENTEFNLPAYTDDLDDTLCFDDFCFDQDSIPDSVDWRDKNVVTEIKNQGQCGSCWSFSTTGSIESQHAIKTGHLVSLSESQIVDCDTNGTDMGCNGGLMDSAFQYIIKTGGLETEQDYPYVPEDDPCTFNASKVAVKISGFKDIVGGEDGLKAAVAKIGPISVAIDASGYDFQLYKKGVYYNPDCSQTMLDHAVLAVGYGTTENGTDYWIVKNSWGENWGMKGYIYMARNRNNSCGIATAASYPLL